MILFISVFTSCFRNTPYTALFERRVGFPRYANEERYRTSTHPACNLVLSVGIKAV